MKMRSSTKEVITRAVRDAGGKEICAVLLQDIYGEQQVIRLPNWSIEPNGFFIAKSELQRVERYAEREGHNILAFIHSHISSLRLSKEDRRSFQNSKYPWIVVCIGPSGLKSRFYEHDATRSGGV